MTTFHSAPEWPRLSEEWPGAKPGQCARCERPESDSAPLTTWQECNSFDRPQPRYVILCRACSGVVIEKHPRLYAALTPHTPAPGAMPLCLDCRHRSATRCMHPEAKINGGPGLHVYGPKGTLVHFLRRGKGARSGWERIFPGPSNACSGKEPIVEPAVSDS